MNPIPKLKVSGKAHELVLRVFDLTRGRAWAHHALLREAMQRSALAVAMHIMRGAHDRRRFPRAIQQAISAVHELTYLLLLSRDLGVLPTSNYATLEARCGELDRMLVGLRQRLLSSGSAARPAGRFPAARAREPVQPDRASHPRAPDLGAAFGLG